MKRRLRRKVRKNKFWLFLLFFVISFMTIGYSLLSVTLEISGVTRIKMNWNIFISEINVIEDNSLNNSKYELIDKLRANFNTTLEASESYVLYEVSVRNQGEMDAILTDIIGLEEANSEDVTFEILDTVLGDRYEGQTTKSFQIKVTPKDTVTEFPIDTNVLNLKLVFEKTEDGYGDITPPNIDPYILSTKTNSITINSNCSDEESGITSYEYKINENEWVNGGNTHEFVGLVTGDYTFQVRCTNGMGLVRESEIFNGSTKEMIVPDILVNPPSDEWSEQKNVTITYDDSQNDFNYQYSLDEGLNWVNATSNIKELNFEEDGTVIAKINDGINEVSTPLIKITNIDSSIPTAPTITGGNSEWSKDDKYIYVVNEATSLSGIKNYQYYLSSSSDELVDGSWIDLDSGEKGVTLPNSGLYYIFMRSINNVGTAGEISNYEQIMIDKTAPVSNTVIVDEVTSNSITVSTNAKDLESGILKYEFSKDNGYSWIESNNNTYTFTNLTTGTYDIKIRVTNTLDLSSVSETVSVPTTQLLTPTYSVNTTNWATEKVVTITYPEKQDSYTYEYSLNGGDSWENANASSISMFGITTDLIVNLLFTENGTVIARVSDGVNVKTASAFTVDKIDNELPTAPVIDGGSEEWTSENVIVEVTKESLALSGIKNYQYYISESKDELIGGEWHTLDTNIKQVTFENEGQYYVFMRAVNNLGIEGYVSNSETVKIDKTMSSASLAITDTTTKSISLEATCIDNESGIAKYEFSKDDGITWVDNGLNSSYKFTNLKTGTYNFKVKCTNNASLTTISDTVSSKTNSITPPSYSIDTLDWATKKVVTITYPSRQEDFIYEYSLNEGESWIQVEEPDIIKDVTFVTNGTIIARISDGINTVTASTYTVDKIDSDIPTAPVIDGGSDTWIKGSKTISVIEDSISTSGIKYYQYYISSSSDELVDGSWIDLESGIKEVNIFKNGISYIYMRAVNNVGIIGDISNYEVTKIDNDIPTTPVITGGSNDWTATNRVISVLNSSTSLSGIKNYQYYISSSPTELIDGEWVSLESGIDNVEITNSGISYIYMRAINSVGSISNYSNYQVVKIDNNIPTAPIITGGSDTWSKTSLTIKVNIPSTSLSGIKNYQYYISSSPTELLDGEWLSLDAGITEKNIDNVGVNYIYFRAINNLDIVGEISLPEKTMIDFTAPTDVDIMTGDITSKSIQIIAIANDLESGITKYEFSKDKGTNWVNNGTSNVYTFTNLVKDNYNMLVRVTNGSGLTTTSKVVVASPKAIDTPTYSINTTDWATEKIVTINYPSREEDYIYDYSLDGGSSWIVVEEPLISKQIVFNQNGTVIARVSDGINIVTASAFTVDKIDNDIPTAPIITGGSEEWKNETITISVTSDSEAESGIKNYEYYISSSATDQVDGEWVSLADNIKEVELNKEGSYYIYFRAISNVGITGEVSLPEIVKIDVQKPTFTLSKQENLVWKKSDSVTVTLRDNLSGLGDNIDISYGLSTSNVDEPTNYSKANLNYNVGDKTSSFTINMSNLTGKYYLWIKLNNYSDKAGNINKETIISNGLFYLDSTIPTIELLEEASANTNEKNVKLTVTDGEALDYIKFPDGTTKSITGNTSYVMNYIVTADGEQVFEVYDVAGNKNSITYTPIYNGPAQLSSLNVDSPATGTYKVGQEIIFTASYNSEIFANSSQQPIDVNSAPKLNIKFGNGENREAIFVSVNGSYITYSYTIQEGDNGLLNLVKYNGVVYNSSGYKTTIIGETLGGNTITADTRGPQVSDITVITSSGTYGPGDLIEFQVVFDENVYADASGLTLVASNAPSLNIQFSDNKVRQARLINVSNNILTYQYGITQEDLGTLKFVSYIGNIYDAIGNEANLDVTSISDFGSNITSSIPAIENANVDSIVSDYGKTIIGDTFSYQNPVIPVGFKPVETTTASWTVAGGTNYPSGWNNGLVIQDENGNQFVWIPVDGNNIIYSVNYSLPSDYSPSTENTYDLDVPIGVISQENQIEKYGGYYIARFEAGDPTASSKRNSNSPTTAIPVSKQGMWPYSYIKMTNINDVAQSISKTNYYVSGLTSGTQWDTMCSWLEKAGFNVTSNSQSWGNYHKNLFSYSMKTTGSSDTYRANNLYDVAGNVWELTAERTTHSGLEYIKRGGTYYWNIAGRYPAGFRMYINPNGNLVEDLVFRWVIYIY